jgi:site-specific recombinase XerC
MTGLEVLRPAEAAVPALIAAAGPDAERRFWEFFAATIRNRHTRRAYLRAVAELCVFAEARGVAALADITPLHVAAHVEHVAQTRAPATVKQRLAAVRMLFDWLVIGGIVPANPAASVRGPRTTWTSPLPPVLAAATPARLD